MLLIRTVGEVYKRIKAVVEAEVGIPTVTGTNNTIIYTVSTEVPACYLPRWKRSKWGGQSVQLELD